MRRALLLSLLVLAGSPAAAGAATVKLTECVPALAPEERSATFEARMRTAPESERMQVRFTLQVREGVLSDWRRVVADGFDEWLTSDAGVSRYTYGRTVRNLRAPAAYRTVVRFRWLDAAGEVLAHARATSRACRQPDMLPDLAVVRVATVAGGYAVELLNDGLSEAGPSSVALSAGEERLGRAEVPALGAGELRVVTLTGPPCEPGSPLVATADPDGAVAERDEGDNVLVATCLP